jgi:hypothetical protein
VSLAHAALASLFGVGARDRWPAWLRDLRIDEPGVVLARLPDRVEDLDPQVRDADLLRLSPVELDALARRLARISGDSWSLGRVPSTIGLPGPPAGAPDPEDLRARAIRLRTLIPRIRPALERLELLARADYPVRMSAPALERIRAVRDLYHEVLRAAWDANPAAEAEARLDGRAGVHSPRRHLGATGAHPHAVDAARPARNHRYANELTGCCRF